MQGKSRRNARTRNQQVWCTRGGMWEFLNLAKFGTEASQAQLVGATTSRWNQRSSQGPSLMIPAPATAKDGGAQYSKGGGSKFSSRRASGTHVSNLEVTS